MRLQNYREHWALERLLVNILISNKNVKVNHLLKNLRFEPLWSLFPLSCLKASGWYRNVLFKARLSSVGKTKEWRDKPVSPTSAVWRIQQCYFMMSIHTEKIRVCAFTLSRGILPVSPTAVLWRTICCRNPDMTLPRNHGKPGVAGRCMKDKWA